MSYLVGFNGARDNYEVALAIHEAGKLERLITDYYDGSAWWARYKLGRRASGLPSGKVRSTFSAFWPQATAKVGRREVDFRLVDQRLGLRIRDAARASLASLLVYSNYARESFADPELMSRARVLFMYHPHPRAIEPILRADFELFPEITQSFHAEGDISQAALLTERLDEEIANATLVLCASSFTARSIASVAGETPIRIIPYGCPAAKGVGNSVESTDGVVRFLFVGQGVQRKGLHHLVRVWEQFASSRAQLTVVSSSVDPAIAERMAALDNLRHLSRLTTDQLAAQYASSDVLVLPSLVEGFGLVLGEALAYGCFLISTNNTGLPDLDLPPWASVTLAPGDLAQLSTTIREQMGVSREQRLDRRRQIKHLAAERSWAQFRTGVRIALDQRLPRE